MNISPDLFLFPVGLSEAPVNNVIPQHNIELLRNIKYFIVENIRSARRWIRRCDPSFSFDGVEFMVLNTHTPKEEIHGMIDPLRKGMPIGVMSEAGCPAVADPGADIVAIAQAEGFRVVPLVGPSSILLGLMGSGFNGQSFCFHGYLPIDEKEKRQALQRLERESEKENRTQIFIETPYRNNKLIEFICNVLSGDTKLCVASDITDPEKEEIVTLPLSKWKKKVYDYSKRPSIFLIYRGKKIG